jgi:hypothetical protein
MINVDAALFASLESMGALVQWFAIMQENCLAACSASF